VQTKSGERRVWEYDNSLRKRDNGAPIVRGMARDITEQRQSEIALRQAEERYRTIFEEAVIGIFQTTPEGKFLNVNPELARMVGYSTPEELMAEVSDLGSQAYVDPSQRAQFLRLLDETGVVRDFEFQVYHREGGKVWLSQNARVVRNAKGEALYYEGTVEDITERKGLEEQLRQSQRLDAIGKLAGGVAHDFNNLLGVIIGYCDILRGKLGEDDPLASDVGHVRKAADSAATLTRQLLAFSRKQVFQSRVIDLNKVMRDLSKMLHRVIGDDVELSIKGGKRLAMVKADPGQIEQVIMNLAVNARDAMPYGGKLQVETGNVELDEAFAREHPPICPGSYVLLRVRDTGCGMSADTLSHIFEPFFTTKEAGKGVGLGLSIVYGIVKQSGGHIWVSSEPGKGTTMEIYLPPTADPREQMTQVPIPVHVGGTETILLVEDEPDLCEMASMVLTNDGYNVLCAHSGEEAIRIMSAQTKPIHLLLTDVILKGGMSGIDLAERVQGVCPGVKVLYMSGYSSDLVTQSGVPGGESELLSKPFSVDALRLRVRAVIDAPNLSESKSKSA
jgi:PAS domain S-box-containing protein